MKSVEENIPNANLMQRRRITLADGRYLIFYTFDESLTAVEPDEKSHKNEENKEKNV